jgi:hypothetical protein
MNSVSYQPTDRGIYMFTKEHAGSSLVYIKSHREYHEFAFLPGPSQFMLSFDDFTKAIKASVLEFVESLPEDIYKETVGCYNSINKKS